MTRYVWEVRVKGGHPSAVKAAVEEAIDHLRNPQREVYEIEGPERAVWTEDVSFAVVSTPAVEGDSISILVDIDIHGEDPTVAAMLSGGFDCSVLEYVMAVPGVVESTHSDRIPRVES